MPAVRGTGARGEWPCRSRTTQNTADIDAETARRARRSLDVSGHYSRPDIFSFAVGSRFTHCLLRLIQKERFSRLDQSPRICIKHLKRSQTMSSEVRFGSKAYIGGSRANVRFVPLAVIEHSFDNLVG